MSLRVAKRFKWEAAHRLPWHAGQCKFLHGHSYRMQIEVAGVPDSHGMLIDFQHLKKILKPLIDQWDHATIVAADDEPLLKVVRQLGTKYFVLPNDTTSENLCAFVVDFFEREVLDLPVGDRLSHIHVRIQETETCYAEVDRALRLPNRN